MRGNASRQLLTLVVVSMLNALAVTGVWFLATGIGKDRAGMALGEEMRTAAHAVDTETERFRSLPAIIARDGRVRDALLSGTGAEIAALNRYLAAVRDDARVDTLYVMRTDGLTIAASNYLKPTSFVGDNYLFRPYFRDAVSSGTGRYYGVGTTSGVPGYFLSSAVMDGSRPIGVVVAKVDMNALQDAWRNMQTVFALADRDGIIFLTGYRPWLYRPLRPLKDETLASIADTRRYDRIDIASAVPILPDGNALPTEVTMADTGMSHLLRQSAIGEDGWVLLGLTSVAPIRATSLLLCLLAALTTTLVTVGFFYAQQRRQLIRARNEAHHRLEQRVVERTAALNKEVEERRHAEAGLREAQASLVEAAKLAALGRMSAAIVHEVSQPLAAMENTLASTGVLAMRADQPAILDKVLAARDLVRRIRRTIRLLRSFARNEPTVLERVDVDKCLAAAVEIAQHRATIDGVRIDLRSSPTPITIQANATRFEQAVLNLLINALDAARDNPTPSVHVWSERRGESILISVRDNGPGVPAALRERITEPFFSTKRSRESLGLGLSIARAIVEDFGGGISFESTPGSGCTFVISLPASPGISLPGRTQRSAAG